MALLTGTETWSTPSDAEARLRQAERRASRERAARIEAEAIAEAGLRDLYESQQRLMLLQRITDGANRNSDISTALRLALTEICEHMGWAFGNAYLREGDAVVACDTWYTADSAGLFDFVEMSRDYRFASGVGLPGRVLVDIRPHWVEDVTQDLNFPRAAIALSSGLHAGCAFPVMVGDEVGAVLEFFSRQRLVPNDAVMTIMAQIGTQLGRVIERERARLALIHDALHDPLTGLPNRTLFADRLASAFGRGGSETGRTTAVMVVDLDGFKAVNDTLGHQAGDRLLVDAARRMERCLAHGLGRREEESKPCHATLARMGGDEFTILIENVRQVDAKMIADAIGECLAATANGDRGDGITASIGVAFDDGSYGDVELLLRDADLAMYEAKARGRNQTVTFGEALGLATRQRLTIEQELRAALAQGEFVLHYQPIVELNEPDRIEGFEALVRWNHPTRGLLGPDQFIDVAEESGLIIFLGNWVLHEACATAARWQRERGSDLPFVSINISPRQFLQPDFARQVHAALLETGVVATSVRLEVTEGAAIRDTERTRTVINKIRSWGVITSLDDFGTGYSSLSHLQRLPFDVLKIDRAFIAALSQTDAYRTATGIVQAILDLARTMGMKVVAEGIETEAQAATLQSLGCTHGQGYLYSRAVAAPVAGDMIKLG